MAVSLHCFEVLSIFIGNQREKEDKDDERNIFLGDDANEEDGDDEAGEEGDICGEGKELKEHNFIHHGEIIG